MSPSPPPSPSDRENPSRADADRAKTIDLRKEPGSRSVRSWFFRASQAFLENIFSVSLDGLHGRQGAMRRRPITDTFLDARLVLARRVASET